MPKVILIFLSSVLRFLTKHFDRKRKTLLDSYDDNFIIIGLNCFIKKSESKGKNPAT